jgi:excisionase family DNA binding protein
MKHNELLNVKEVAEYLQLKESTVYTWAQQDRIPAIKVGRRWQFRQSDLEAWLAEHAQPVVEDSTSER